MDSRRPEASVELAFLPGMWYRFAIAAKRRGRQVKERTQVMFTLGYSHMPNTMSATPWRSAAAVMVAVVAPLFTLVVLVGALKRIRGFRPEAIPV